jgi:3-phytase
MPPSAPSHAWRDSAGPSRTCAASTVTGAENGMPPRRSKRFSFARARIKRASAHRFALLCLASTALAACTSVQVTRPVSLPTPPAPSGVLVPERYIAAGDAHANFNALATWPTENGGAWLIAGSATEHTLTVFDADSGARIRDIDARKEAPGPMLEPAALAIFGDHLFVTETNAHRVGVLSLPDFTRIGTFGEGELFKPGGIWVRERGPQELAAYVTDESIGKAGGRRYLVEFDDAGQLRARSEAAFDHMGAPDTGGDLPWDSYHGTANSIVWWSCGTDVGYWIAVDPGTAPTRFLLLDRHGKQLGAFHGETTSGGKAIALYAAGTMQFPFGVLFAVHEGGSVAAFDLSDVVRALQLDPVCTQ